MKQDSGRDPALTLRAGPLCGVPVASPFRSGVGRAIPDRRPLSHAERGIKLIINHAHIALVLRVKQQLEDLAA